MRRYIGGMPLLANVCLSTRKISVASIRGVSEFVSVIGPALTTAFPDVKVEAYRSSVVHLNFISVVDGSTLIWCEQNVLREAMREELLFVKIAETDVTAVNFNNHFHDGVGELDRGHHEVLPKLWNWRSYDKTRGELTRIPRLIASYQKVRKKIKTGVITRGYQKNYQISP